MLAKVVNKRDVTRMSYLEQNLHHIALHHTHQLETYILTTKTTVLILNMLWNMLYYAHINIKSHLLPYKLLHCRRRFYMKNTQTL